jgi:hypothetical protein
MTGRPAVAEARLRAYLEAVAAALPGPRRHRGRILDELGDGLDRAAADRTAAGLGPAEAVDAAIDAFGTPDVVADAFAGELATASARRMLGWFVATGPLVGMWWLLLLHPQPWQAGVVALLAAIPVIPLVAVALATAAGTFATTGRLMRWLPETGPRRALAGVVAVGVLVIGADATIIAVYLGSGLPVGPLAVVGVTTSVIRSGCSVRAVSRAVELRGRLADGTGHHAGR